MYHLIKKDFIIQKKQVMLTLLIMVFFSFTLSAMGSAGLTVSILAISYMLVFGAGTMEDKNNSDAMLISLPIRKQTIVLGKYVSIYMFAAYALLANFVIHVLAELLRIPNVSFPFTIEGVLQAVAVVTFFFSISFPLAFKYGYVKSKIANLIVLFTFVFAGTFLIEEVIPEPRVEWFQSGAGMAAILLMVLILLLVSFLISVTFYKNREF